MLTNQVKMKLKKLGLANINYNNFTLTDGNTEQELINAFDIVYSERIINV